jgi:hypothetical protein
LFTAEYLSKFTYCATCQILLCPYVLTPRIYSRRYVICLLKDCQNNDRYSAVLWLLMYAQCIHRNLALAAAIVYEYSFARFSFVYFPQIPVLFYVFFALLCITLLAI